MRVFALLKSIGNTLEFRWREVRADGGWLLRTWVHPPDADAGWEQGATEHWSRR